MTAEKLPKGSTPEQTNTSARAMLDTADSQMLTRTHRLFPHLRDRRSVGCRSLFCECPKPYNRCMVSRTYGRGRPLNAPAAFIHPRQPIVAKQPPNGDGWAHELKHDDYRLQIHVWDGRV